MYAKVTVQFGALNVLSIIFVRIIAFNLWHVTYNWYTEIEDFFWEFHLNRHTF